MKRLTSAIAICAIASGSLALNAEPHPYDDPRLGFGDFADMTTTAIALNKGGFVEGNPLLAPFGKATPLAGLGLKYGMKRLMVASGSTPAEANVSGESFGMLGACNNIAVMAGANPYVAISLGIVCGLISKKHMKTRYERETGRKLNGDPLVATTTKAAPQRAEKPIMQVYHNAKTRKTVRYSTVGNKPVPLAELLRLTQ